MDIYFFGFTSVRIRGKKTSIVVDPFSKESAGKKFEKTEADAVLLTKKDDAKTTLTQVENYRVVIDGPGEYEVGGVSILGVPMDGATIFAIKIDGVVVLHLARLVKSLTDAELDKLPAADIVFVPTGKDTADLVAKLEPKIVIPLYEDGTLFSFLKEIGKEGTKPQSKLTITKEKLPGEMEVVVLE